MTLTRHTLTRHTLSRHSLLIFCRSMTLLLTENKGLFGPTFSVTSVKDNGEEVEEPFNPHIFYKGVVVGKWLLGRIVSNWNNCWFILIYRVVIDFLLINSNTRLSMLVSHPHFPYSTHSLRLTLVFSISIHKGIDFLILDFLINIFHVMITFSASHLLAILFCRLSWRWISEGWGVGEGSPTPPPELGQASIKL